VEPTTASSTGALITRLRQSYIHRPDTTGAHRAATSQRDVGRPEEERPIVACTVLAVARVDDERRWVWPAETGRARPSAVSLRPRSGCIEVLIDPEGGSAVRVLDGRGRLRLPIGVLRWAGLRVGDRLALVAHADPSGSLFLVPSSALLAPSLDGS
jgi:hypothetical protein